VVTWFAEEKKRQNNLNHSATKIVSLPLKSVQGRYLMDN
jgi:hypothetical protein